MPETETIDCIASATAAYGMQQLANWLPANRHEELRELLYDLTVGALHALRGVDAFCVPEPSTH